MDNDHGARCSRIFISYGHGDRPKLAARLAKDRRRILHVGATYHPTDAWSAAEIEKARLPKQGIQFLVRDNDTRYRGEFPRRMKGLHLIEKKIAPFAFWENVYCERVIGTIRQERTDHLLIMYERPLCDVLREYADYYNEARTYLSLERNAPEPRAREPASNELRVTPVLGGLNPRYRVAA